MKNKPNGFTLVELSVVLVIIALIIGSVATGRSMLRRSKVMAAGVTAQTYINATLAFKQKYNALPGDMINATNYWGAMTTCPPAAGQASAGGTATCNGNGDGIVGVPYYGAGGNFYEDPLFWQQLANEGLIGGAYTGIEGAGGAREVLPGINSPAGRIDGSGYSIQKLGIALSSYVYPANYGHVFNFGTKIATMETIGPVLTAAEALAVDLKYDDGLPASGNILSFTPSVVQTPYCTTSGTATSALYNTSYPGLVCSLIFVTGF